MGIGLQDPCAAADPKRVTIAGVSSAPNQAMGLAGVRSRISEIQQRLGVAAAWAGVNTPTAAAPAAKSTADANSLFLQALQQAQTGSNTGTGSTGTIDLNSMLGSAGASTIDSTATSLANALGTTPVYSTKPQGLPALGVTDTMAAAGNGNLPDSMLTGIGQGDHRLAKPAADAFTRMTAAARRDGVTFGVNDSYRSYAEQVDVANRLGLYGQGGVAAIPGTSNHGWGLAVDLELDGKAQAWMQENAWRYGYFGDVPGEPWHWTYRAS